MSGEQQKTFYIETFGCQMNVHDSEKVIGTLVSQGYRQVTDEQQAGLILYNTCSIRDKAEQKVFHRLNEYKKLQGEGKKFGVLGCVAQQEGEHIFERAPYVSLVAGSASYRNLPQMLVQLEAGKRVTGLDDRQTDEPFRIAGTSLLSKDVTSCALTAWSHTRAAKSAAGHLNRFWLKRGRWPAWATPTSNCLAKT
jgi:tRNA-2-methylthio-N6-dimethylallyladenosine synthase